MGIKLKERNKNYIPDMVHPLGKGWTQPKRKDILIDDTHAIMSKESFNKLYNYSHSYPSGAYEGKMWKGEYTEGGWYLRWFGFHDDPNLLSSNTRNIIIL